MYRILCAILCVAAGLLAQTDERNDPIWREFGLEQVRRTPEATIYRLKDTTGALAALQWQQAFAPAGEVTQAGNYVLRWSAVPNAEQAKQVQNGLEKLDRSALPPLPSYLPASGRVPQTERYSLGEHSLKQFEPRLPVGAVGFDKGAEVQLASFRQKGGEPSALALVLYPTPQIARQQANELSKVPNATVRRKSSLVGVVFGPDERVANRLLDEIRYQPIVMWNEKVPKPERNFGLQLLDMIVLAGILMAASIGMGLFFGGFRLFRQKSRQGVLAEPMITLHLSDK